MDRPIAPNCQVSVRSAARLQGVDEQTVKMIFDERKASRPVILGYLMDIIPEHLLKDYAPDVLLPSWQCARHNFPLDTCVISTVYIKHLLCRSSLNTASMTPGRVVDTMSSRRGSLPQRAIDSDRRRVCNYRDTLRLMASRMLLLAPHTRASHGFLLR
jgi:hypothetical protein